MSVLLCILISIAVNLDNFLIGVNLGLKHHLLKMSSNIMIALMTALATTVAALITWLISDEFLTVSNVLGAGFLIVFGIFCLIHNDNDDEIAEKYKDLTITKSLLLGLVLSINCIPPAFSAGMLDISPVIIGLCTGFFSFLCMFISNKFGTFFSRLPYIHKVTPVSYGLLIFTGIIEIIFINH